MKVSEIVDQNPWWAEGTDFVSHDPHLKAAQPIFFRRRPLEMAPGDIYTLRGPRQVGKTTYFKETVKELLRKGVPPRTILYLSVDFFTSRRELRSALDYFLGITVDAERIYLLFDEITAIPDWNFELKRLADQGVTRRAVILCSGSSAPRLKEKAELLPGRGLEGNERYIKPLSFREFVLQVVSYLAEVLPSEELAVRFGRLQPVLSRCEIELEASLEEIRKAMSELLPYKRELQYLFRLYLITGGIPLVINHYLKNRYQDSQEKIDSQVAEIFMRSVLGDLSQLKRQETLAREILRALAAKYGSRYSFSTLSHELERHHLTIIDYLTLMQESFILFVLYAYDFGRMEVKDKGDKKIYFLDPFIYYSVRSYLNGREVWKVITETAEDEDRLGGVVEGVVLSHLLMHKEVPYLREGRTFLWTYYDRAGRELDAVIRLAKGYRAVEIKYQAQVDERNLRRTAPIKDYILLSRDEVGGRNNLLIAPVDIFLSLLPVSKGNV